MTARLRAQYFLETPLELEDVRAPTAGEQLTGTFVQLPDETDEGLWQPRFFEHSRPGSPSSA